MPPTRSNDTEPAGALRLLSRLTPLWKPVRFPPPHLPASWPPSMPLLDIEDDYLDEETAEGVPPRELALLRTSLAAPRLCIPDFRLMTYGTRADNAHLLLAHEGDCVLRSILEQTAVERGWTWEQRHHVTTNIRSKATLAQIANESGLMHAALHRAPLRDDTFYTLPQKCAADIVKATIAAMDQSMGRGETTVWVQELTQPWVDAALPERNDAPILRRKIKNRQRKRTMRRAQALALQQDDAPATNNTAAALSPRPVNPASPQAQPIE